jgi:hypothetical protein
MHAKLKEFVEETTAKLLESLTPEKRLEGLSAQQLARAIPPDMRETLARLLKTNGHSAEPGAESTDRPRE